MANILVIRFSALGDIAMTVPVISEMARQYPEHNITMLSRGFVAPLFNGLAPNISFRGVDLKADKYKGIGGIYRLYKELKTDKYDYIIDLHDVLRTKILRTFFRLNGAKVSSIDKERAKRNRYIKTKDKSHRLSTSFEKYTLAFNRAGFTFNNGFISIFGNSTPNLSEIESFTSNLKGNRWIGIAPFTTHRGKEYPTALTEQVVKAMSSLHDVSVLLFGAGKREKEILESWENKYENVYSVAGKLDMKKELILMSRLKVMVSMDSANMHLASLVATPVISIWGATHPGCGFMGWNQSEGNAIQLDLPCRPCSVFGKKECIYKDYRCLDRIRPEVISDKIKKFL